VFAFVVRACVIVVVLVPIAVSPPLASCGPRVTTATTTRNARQEPEQERGDQARDARRKRHEDVRAPHARFIVMIVVAVAVAVAVVLLVLVLVMIVVMVVVAVVVVIVVIVVMVVVTVIINDKR
jgi:Flp pilus assembly protein TadB